jgi:hypothetical protein
MAVQASVQTTIAYKAETSFGVQPTAPGAQLLRRVSSSLAASKDTFASNEVRSDFQVNDVRHGIRSVRGNIEGELSNVTYDDWLEALLRGTWAAGSSVAPAQFATGVTIANTTLNGVACSNLTFVGGGNLLTLGFKIGDMVRGTGLTNAANNGINLRIVNLTGTVMTVFPQLAVTAQQAAGWSITTPGRKLTMGTQKRSFTIEQAMADATLWERFTGVRVGGATFNVQPTGMSTVSWELMGQNFVIGTASQYFTSPASETTTGVLSGIDGNLRLNGEEQAVVTGLQINFSNNLSMQPVIGSQQVPDIFYGRMVVTGTVSAYLEDADLINAFVNESEIDLVAVLETGANPQDFLSFNLQRIKLTGAQKTIGPDGGVIAQFPFQALLKAGGTGTAFEQSTLTIQRSNV